MSLQKNARVVSVQECCVVAGMQENVGMGDSVVGSSCSDGYLNCAQRVSEYLLAAK